MAAAREAALQHKGVRDALGWVSSILKQAAAQGASGAGVDAGKGVEGPAVAASDGRGCEGSEVGKGVEGPEVGKPASSASEVGHEREAAEEAEAAGQLVNVPLYAPGHIYWLVGGGGGWGLRRGEGRGGGARGREEEAGQLAIAPLCAPRHIVWLGGGWGRGQCVGVGALGRGLGTHERGTACVPACLPTCLPAHPPACLPACLLCCLHFNP